MTSQTTRACALCTTAVAAALAVSGPALGAPNTTISNVDVLNLLSPFLSLEATSAGQTTLSHNLAQALATNHYAGQSPIVESTSISDKTIFSGAATSITLFGSNAASTYGPAANLAGGLPGQAIQNGATPGMIVPSQPVGGLSGLGAAFQAAVSAGGVGAAYPASGPAAGAASLLINAYAFTSGDLGVAKYYFANGTLDGATRAVAPPGYALPASNGLPNASSSVYDLAYGVTNTGSGQNIYGDSRPVQADPAGVLGYDPNALTGLQGNPSFPSGHTNYAFTDGILVGMLVPQFYQSMLLRASEYGNSRIDLGVHYPLDIIASRSFVQYDLAQLLNGNPGYTVTNAVGSATPYNLSAQFAAAQPQLTTALGGASAIQAAAAQNNANAANSYNAYSLAAYAGQGHASQSAVPVAAGDREIFAYRMNYGLPTLSFSAAPQEPAPTGGPDASILLAPVYGGGSAAAQTIAPTGGLYGQLATATIDQIVVNTESQALAAFYGTPLSYWSRINLYDAIGYFGNLTGSLILASTDRVSTNVVVDNGGVLQGSGVIGSSAAPDAVEVRSGGVLFPGAAGEAAAGRLTINGALTFDAGSQLAARGIAAAGVASNDAVVVNGNLTISPNASVSLSGMVMPGSVYRLITVNGVIAGAFNPTLAASPGSLSSLISAQLLYTGGGASFKAQSDFAAAARTPNQAQVAAAIDAASNVGGYGANGAALIAALIANNTVATAPAAFDALSGEGLTGAQQMALDAAESFVETAINQSDGAADARPVGAAGVWAAGFGKSSTLEGEASSGSAKLTDYNGGGASGLDLQATPGLLIGLMAGGSNSGFGVSDRQASGHADNYHFGAYALERFGDVYASGAIAYSNFSNTTRRTINGFGGLEGEVGRFDGHETLARFEGGYRARIQNVGLTPFGGFQVGALHEDGFSENSSGLLGLTVQAHDVTSDKIFLGGQIDARAVLAQSPVDVFARLSWDHEFHVERDLTAALQSLPYAFQTSGASAAKDAAHLKAGAERGLSAHASAFASFDGVFSGRETGYAGNVGVRFRW